MAEVNYSDCGINENNIRGIVMLLDPTYRYDAAAEIVIKCFSLIASTIW